MKKLVIFVVFVICVALFHVTNLQAAVTRYTGPLPVDLDDIYIEGTDGDDAVEITSLGRDSTGKYQYEINLNNGMQVETVAYDLEGITGVANTVAVYINLKAGDDIVEYDTLYFPFSCTVNLGEGNDVFTYKGFGTTYSDILSNVQNAAFVQNPLYVLQPKIIIAGPGDDVILGTYCDDTIIGESGTDYIILDLGGNDYVIDAYQVRTHGASSGDVLYTSDDINC